MLSAPTLAKVFVCHCNEFFICFLSLYPFIFYLFLYAFFLYLLCVFSFSQTVRIESLRCLHAMSRFPEHEVNQSFILTLLAVSVGVVQVVTLGLCEPCLTMWV